MEQVKQHSGRTIADLEAVVTTYVGTSSPSDAGALKTPDSTTRTVKGGAASLEVAPLDSRYAEINWDGESWGVVLWDAKEESSAGEQEFLSFVNPDLQKYVEAWTKYGRVIF